MIERGGKEEEEKVNKRVNPIKQKVGGVEGKGSGRYDI